MSEFSEKEKMIARDDIAALLIEGDPADLKGVRCPDCGGRIAYEYGERHGTFSVKCSCTQEYLCKVLVEPAYVKAYGSKGVV